MKRLITAFMLIFAVTLTVTGCALFSAAEKSAVIKSDADFLKDDFIEYWLNQEFGIPASDAIKKAMKFGEVTYSHTNSSGVEFYDVTVKYEDRVMIASIGIYNGLTFSYNYLQLFTDPDPWEQTSEQFGNIYTKLSGTEDDSMCEKPLYYKIPGGGLVFRECVLKTYLYAMRLDDNGYLRLQLAVWLTEVPEKKAEV